MWSCVSCEMFSAYKMKAKNLISKAVPVLKDDKGNWVRNPQVITDQYVKNGEIVYGENKTGQEAKEARAWVNEKLKNNDYDFSLVDAEVDRVIWIFANLFPGCLMKSIDGIRQKKKFFWDTHEERSPILAGHEHDGRGLPRLRRIQHQEDHRRRHDRLHQEPPAHRRRRVEQRGVLRADPRETAGEVIRGMPRELC